MHTQRMGGIAGGRGAGFDVELVCFAATDAAWSSAKVSLRFMVKAGSGLSSVVSGDDSLFDSRNRSVSFGLLIEIGSGETSLFSLMVSFATAEDEDCSWRC